MLKSLVTVILSAFTVLHANARIGETLEQCKVRYGTPITESKSSAAFIKAGFVIGVMFYEGKVDSLAIVKVEKDALGKSIEMSDNEISQLLQANSGNRKWKEHTCSFDRSWLTEDAQVVAIYEPSKRQLTIMTKDAAERSGADKKAEENKTLKDF